MKKAKAACGKRPKSPTKAMDKKVMAEPADFAAYIGMEKYGKKRRKNMPSSWKKK